jgi:hypothetical protein
VRKVHNAIEEELAEIRKGALEQPDLSVQPGRLAGCVVVGAGPRRFRIVEMHRQAVTIKTIRNWHFVGTLAGGSTKGTVFESSSGNPIAPEMCVRPVKT